MHYYKRNLGDYAKKAGRLSMLQHGSYTLLLDSCYDREQFPTMEEAIEWTWASNTEEIEAVQFVLRKFFTLEEGRYVQTRIRDELADYQRKSRTNTRIANERETKRAESDTNRAQVVDDASTDRHLTTNQEPLTTNQEPVVTKPPKPPAGAVELPEWLPQDRFDAFVAHRRALKKPMTPEARRLLVKKMDGFRASGHSPTELLAALDTAIERGWLTVFMPENNRSPPAPFASKRPQKFDPVAYVNQGVRHDSNNLASHPKNLDAERVG